MADYETEAIVVGAGVVGLAVARALALRGREVLVIEAARGIGSGISSRNSEVVHSGLYYPRGSLKARLCVEGRRLLYAYCAEKAVPHRACGKIVVASEEADLGALAALAEAGRANDVDDLSLVDGAAVRALEPAVAAKAGLLCPSSGIVDSHALMSALRHDLESAGGSLVLDTPVEGGEVGGGRTVLRTGGRDPARIATRVLVNAAGLFAPALCRRLDGFPVPHAPQAYFAKGNYFALTTRAPFARLVYPLPEPGGLGVHATIDLAGRVRFGPDVEWVAGFDDYAVDAARGAAFYAAIRRYWPGLPEGALAPDYAGIRPKLVGPGAPAADFVVQTEATHGVAGLVNLLGIESPGLTASLALGEMVADTLLRGSNVAFDRRGAIAAAR